MNFKMRKPEEHYDPEILRGKLDLFVRFCLENTVKGGTLVFFSSYSKMNEYWNRIKNNNIVFNFCKEKGILMKKEVSGTLEFKKDFKVYKE